MKAVLIDPATPDELAFLREHAPHLDLMAPTTGAAEALATLLEGAEALIARDRIVDAQLLQEAPRSLRLVQLWSNRRDGVDLEAAADAGVTVALMPQRGCIAVAELTMLLLLGLSKKIAAADDATRSGAYRSLGIEPILTEERKHFFQWMKLPDLFELYGHTLGLVGFGEIATEVARRAHAFGVNVVYTKRNRLSSEMEREEHVDYREFDDLLAESDFVSLHVPHTPETDGLIDARALEQMKSSAFLVNTCRGGVVDEYALVSALQAKTIAGAGLDVFRYEPAPHDHPLLKLDNVLLTPHIGGGSGGARVKQAADVLGNVERFARGEEPRHVILEGTRR